MTMILHEKNYVIYQVLSNLQTLELIQNDGSPCGPKYFILWNPPLNLVSMVTHFLGFLPRQTIRT